MEIAENCHLGQASSDSTTGESEEAGGEGSLFYRGKAGVGKAVVNQKSIGVNWKFEVQQLLIGWPVTVAHIYNSTGQYRQSVKWSSGNMAIWKK